MALSSQVEALVRQWRVHRDRGRAVPIEELCAQSPELIPQVRVAIHESDASDDELATTNVLETPPLLDTPGPAQSKELPVIPGYEVQQFLKQGGQAAVYKVYNRPLDRVEALKLLSNEPYVQEEHIHRFLQDARAMGGLEAKSPHIARVYEVTPEEAGPPYYFTMQYAAHGDLGGHLRRFQQDPKKAAALIEKVARAVHVAHADGILHRDLKPGNILLDANDEPLVTDFGLAKLQSADQELTGMNVVLGTAPYMAPEQTAGDPTRVTAASDIWALGVVLYELLTGKRPFAGRGDDLSRRIREADPPGPRSLDRKIPKDLETICLKCLEKEPGRRFETAAELAEELANWRDGKPIKTRPEGWPRQLTRWLRRYRWQIAASVLALALLGLTAALIGHEPEAHLTGEPAHHLTIHLRTEPPGANVALVPMDEYGEPRPERRIRPPGKTPLSVAQVPVGNYLVVVEIANFGFHEVYRVVPGPGQAQGRFAHERWIALADGTVETPVIPIRATKVAADGMALFAGGEFDMGLLVPENDPLAHRMFAPAHRRAVSSFYLDTTEVTVGAYRDIYGGMPADLPKDTPIEFPVTRVPFDRAIAYAERVGKRLPTEAEYEYAATMGGTRDYPWGPEAGRLKLLEEQTNWRIGPVRHPLWDQAPTDPPVYGLYSNAVEWTDSLPTPYRPKLHPSILREQDGGLEYFRAYVRARVARGGPGSLAYYDDGRKPALEEVAIGPRYRLMPPRSSALPGLGFRCARSVGPRFLD